MSDRSWVFGDRPKRRAPPPAPPRAQPTPSEAGERIVVEYAPIRCPLCGSVTKCVDKKKDGVRYHYCKGSDCGLRFLSIERLPRILSCPGQLRHLLRRDDRR